MLLASKFVEELVLHCTEQFQCWFKFLFFADSSDI